MIFMTLWNVELLSITGTLKSWIYFQPIKLQEYETGARDLTGNSKKRFSWKQFVYLWTVEIAILSPEHFLQKYNRFDYFKKCLVNLKILEFVDQIYVPNYFEIRPSRKKVLAKRIFWMTLVKLIYLIRVMYMYISRVINLSFNTKITFVKIAL